MSISNGACYQRIRAVDIQPILDIWPSLQFVSVNRNSPEKCPCDVVLTPVPQVQQLLDELQLGGRTNRAIIRRLAPYQGIAPHTDTWMPAELNWRRFQVPLVTHPEILMRWPDDGVEAHLEPGFLYEVCFTKKHEVVNNTDCARAHLQIDQVDATI